MTQNAFEPPLSTDPPLTVGQAKIPVETHIHVKANHGPTEVTCVPCNRLMLPMWTYSSRYAIDAGMERWACLPCWRSILITWSDKEPA